VVEATLLQARRARLDVLLFPILRLETR